MPAFVPLVITPYNIAYHPDFRQNVCVVCPKITNCFDTLAPHCHDDYAGGPSPAKAPIER